MLALSGKTAAEPTWPTKDGAVLTFDNGVHAIYANGAYSGGDAIGWLMHGFREGGADKMHYAEIAGRVRFHKRQDGKRRREKENSFARKLIQKSELPLEDVAEIADLPPDQVQALEGPD